MSKHLDQDQVLHSPLSPRRDLLNHPTVAGVSTRSPLREVSRRSLRDLLNHNKVAGVSAGPRVRGP
jgi:hypothetical protein